MNENKKKNETEELRQLTTVLHGLSFGEHDGGAQRNAVSERLSDLFHYFASGLLKAEQPERYDGFLDALLHLLSSTVVSLIVWEHIPSESILELLERLSRRAADETTILPDQYEKAQSSPVQLTLRLLHAVLSVFHATSISLSRDIAADLIFALFRIDDWTDFPTLREEIHQMLEEKLNRSKRADLHRYVFTPSFHDRFLRCVQFESTLSDPISSASAHDITPVVSVIRSIVFTFVSSVDNPDGLGIESHALRLLRLAVLLSDHVHHDTRHSALESVSKLVPFISKSELLREKGLLEPITSSMLWAKPETTVIAIPLIGTLLRLKYPVPALADTPPDAWREAKKMVLSTLQRHISKREDDKVSQPDIDAVVASVGYVSRTFEQTLLSTDWMSSLSELLRIVSSAGNVEHTVVVCSVISDSLKFVWLNPSEFRETLLDACVVAVGKSRRCENRDRLITAVKEVMLALTRCAQASVTLDILRDLNAVAKRYASLEDFATCLEDVLSMAEADERTIIDPGPLVSKYFPEMIS